MHSRHRAQDVVGFLRAIESAVEPTLDIHGVLDDLSAHGAPPAQRVVAASCPRVLIFTPTDALWLNLVERLFYTKSYAPGTLNARWMFSGKYSGPGIATGGPKEGVAGSYHVRYFYDSGECSDEYDLVIKKIAES